MLDEGYSSIVLTHEAAFAEAKDIHDELEDCYINEMDFGALDRLTDDLTHSTKETNRWRE